MIDLGEPYFPKRVGTKEQEVSVLKDCLDVKTRARLRPYRMWLPKGVLIRLRCLFCTNVTKTSTEAAKVYLDADLVDTWIKAGGLACSWAPYYCGDCVTGPLKGHYEASPGPVAWQN